MPTRKTNNDAGKKALGETRARLYRSEANRLLGGIAGGIGEYFDIDPTIIRIVFILLTIFGGSGFLLYIILWLIVPSESSAELISEEDMQKNVDEIKTKAKHFSRAMRIGTLEKNHSWWAALLIILGVLFLFNNYGLFSLQLTKIWPFILIGIGLFLLWKRK